jgi:hypothetical protein
VEYSIYCYTDAILGARKQSLSAQAYTILVSRPQHFNIPYSLGHKSNDAPTALKTSVQHLVDE